MMDGATEQEISRELSPTERLLWAGRPLSGLRFRPADVFFIPFSLLWGGFAIFWEWSVFNSNAPFFFWLWGIPFVLAGVYLIVGRFFVDAWQRDKTYYGVTNERIIIVSGLLNRKVKTLNLRTLSDLSLSERSDRSGTISLGATNPFAPWFGGMAWPGMGQYVTPGFEMIQNAKTVYDIIRRAQAGP